MTIAEPDAARPPCRIIRSGTFSGSGTSLVRAMSQITPVADIDLMPFSRAPTLLPYRAAAMAEALVSTDRPRWRMTAAWSKGMQTWCERSGVLQTAGHLLFIQTVHGFDIDVPYSVYTDRVGLEGAAATGPYRSRFTSGWLTRERRFLQQAHRVFTMGPSTTRYLIEDYELDPDRIVVAGSGTNASPATLRKRHGCTTLLFVGTQFDLKGGPLLLDAFTRARRRHPDLRLLIVGSEPTTDLPPGVECLGVVPLEEMTGLYARADAYVVPTWMEAYGVALVEALSSGLPCIGTTVGNQGWLIGDAGLTVPPGDADRLQEAIEELVTNYPRYESAARHRNLEQQVSTTWSNVAAHITSVLGTP